LRDLGDIHYKFGYLHEAINKWATSHDYSSVKEDKLNIAQKISFAAFELNHQFFMTKYSGLSRSYDDEKDASLTMTIAIQQAIAAIFSGEN